MTLGFFVVIKWNDVKFKEEWQSYGQSLHEGESIHSLFVPVPKQLATKDTFLSQLGVSLV